LRSEPLQQIGSADTLRAYQEQLRGVQTHAIGLQERKGLLGTSGKIAVDERSYALLEE
jgi:hypothetical protein